MKPVLKIALVVAAAAETFAATIDIGTGSALWQIFNPRIGIVPATTLTVSQQNPSWAPAPAGSAWVSYGSFEGTSCTFGQLPGNSCANALTNANGDSWEYILNVPASTLGTTSGTINFVFGGDSRVAVWTGNIPGQFWSGLPPSNTNGVGYANLGCSNTRGTYDVGNTQASYFNCTTTLPFASADLNVDSSMTIYAYSYNDPIAGCPDCGNPTGFVLQGNIFTAHSDSPEPGTMGLVALAVVAGLALRRKR